MTALPSAEAILLKILQSLGGPIDPANNQSNKKKKFARGDARLEEHIKMGRDVLQDIFEALEMGESAQGSAGRNLMDFTGAYKGLELGTWTFDSDQRQVFWMLLGYFYIPGLARYAAWWTINSRMDRNMAGGRFWYLPELREKNGKASLQLPVAQVVDWLLDLLGMSVEEFGEARSAATNEGHDSLRRSLYSWRKGVTLTLPTIAKYFHDKVELQFTGAFSSDENAALDTKFAAAIAFVNRKGLTAEHLRAEIPMTAKGRLEAVLEGRADNEENSRFVALITERYAPPSPRTIRQYLGIARAVQNGYTRMLEVLCPGVERRCADPSQNKLLQAFGLYKFVYNLTIEAWQMHGVNSEDVENSWFEEQLPPQLACGPLLSILPSSRESNIDILAELLNRHFEKTPPGAELEDLLPSDKGSDIDIATRNLDRVIAIMDERAAATELSDRVKSGGPWAKLQAETRFRVVAQISGQQELSERVRPMLIARLHELAKTPEEEGQAILIELAYHLNGSRKHRTSETKGRVKVLLDKAEVNPGYRFWKAPLIQYRAKHLLAQNDFEGAFELFRGALAACTERSFGRFHCEIGRDCFAMAIVNRGLVENDHEKYFRAMLRGDIFPEGATPRIKDAVPSVYAYFWDTLYKPYTGFEVRQP